MVSTAVCKCCVATAYVVEAARNSVGKNNVLYSGSLDLRHSWRLRSIGPETNPKVSTVVNVSIKSHVSMREYEITHRRHHSQQWGN